MAKMDIETRKRTEAHVTKEDIKDGFEKLGLKTGDNVGVTVLYAHLDTLRAVQMPS